MNGANVNEADEKDIIILKLQKEIYELQQFQPDYNMITEQVRKLENEFDDVYQQKEKLEHELKNSQNNQKNIIRQFQHQIDCLNRTIEQKQFKTAPNEQLTRFQMENKTIKQDYNDLSEQFENQMRTDQMKIALYEQDKNTLQGAIEERDMQIQGLQKQLQIQEDEKRKLMLIYKELEENKQFGEQKFKKIEEELKLQLEKQNEKIGLLEKHNLTLEQSLRKMQEELDSLYEEEVEKQRKSRVTLQQINQLKQKRFII